MTNRELVNKPSQFMVRLLKPLSLLSENQGFSNLSEGLRTKVNENVIKTALEDMKEVIKEIMTEETNLPCEPEMNSKESAPHAFLP